MLRQMSEGAVLVYKIHRASTYVTIIFVLFEKIFFFLLFSCLLMLFLCAEILYT